MNYNFTNDCRNALSAAREEALRLGHNLVDTQHLLLGLVSDPAAPGAVLLVSLGASPEQVRAAVERRVRPGSFHSEDGVLPYSALAKQTLEQSMGYAAERSLRSVTSRELVAGLLRLKRGVALEVLAELGVTRERVEGSAPAPQPPRATPNKGLAAQVLEGLGATLEALRGGSAHPRTGLVRIDDGSELPIRDQIVAQLQEAAATGRVATGERLPSVRQLADELEIAPGTVARAYAELERLGVVITDGARGTRVAPRPATPAHPQQVARLAEALRPAVVLAFHQGATAAELRAALEAAMEGIFNRGEEGGGSSGPPS